jgi:hypothetical protein
MPRLDRSDMRQIVVTSLIVAAACWPGLLLAQPAASVPGPSAAAVTEPNPQAPPFKPDMVVVDRTGARVGVVVSVTDSASGPNVVLRVDGKLVAVAPTTLKLQDQTVISSQSKAEMLASVGALQ